MGKWTSSSEASAWPQGARGRVEVRATWGQGGQRDLVQPWLARLRLVNCMPAMPNLCSEEPQWYLERQQSIPADKQPANQGQRWGCMSETLINCACFCPYFVPLFVLQHNICNSIKFNKNIWVPWPVGYLFLCQVIYGIKLAISGLILSTVKHQQQSF